MAKKPDDRPQNAEEIRDQLSAITLTLTATGANRATVSGPMSSVPCPAGTAKVNKAVAAALVTTLVGVAGLAGFFFMWPGPPEDRGTPANKMFFAAKLSDASDLASKGNYAEAEKTLNEAESLAITLNGGGNTRLELVLKQKADLYGKWEGHAELLEKTNNRIIDLITVRALAEMKRQYESLKRLETFPTNSSVAQTNAKLRAEAEVPSILVTAGKLNARKLHLEQSKFLEKSLAVMRRLLGPDSPSVCRIEGSLCDAYLGMRNIPPVRPLLVHICSVTEKQLDTKPEDYIRALARLGQFDLDQSRMKDAEPELKKALDLGTEKKMSKDLQVLLMRSWADVLNQTNRQKESQEISKKADELEKTATDIPASEKL